MQTCAHLKRSLKWSFGWATSTAVWTPSSTLATTVSSSWPSSASCDASVTSANVLAGAHTITAPQTSAPPEIHAKALQTTTRAAWTAASAPCLLLPVQAPATWVRVFHLALRERHYTSGGQPHLLPPHLICCLAALQTSSRELWEGREGEENQLRRQLVVFSLSPLGRTETREGSTKTALHQRTRCDCWVLLSCDLFITSRDSSHLHSVDVGFHTGLLHSLYMVPWSVISQWIVILISGQYKVNYWLCCCITGVLSYFSVSVVDKDRNISVSKGLKTANQNLCWDWKDTSACILIKQKRNSKEKGLLQKMTIFNTTPSTLSVKNLCQPCKKIKYETKNWLL